MSCPYPQCYYCIIKEPKSKQPSLIRDALRKLPNDHVDMQDMWTCVLEETFDSRRNDKTELQRRCRMYCSLGLVECILHLLSNPNNSATTIFHALHIIKNITCVDYPTTFQLSRGSHLFNILKRCVQSKWTIFRHVSIEIITYLMAYMPCHEIPLFFSSEILSVLIQHGFPSEQECMENWEKGAFQEELWFRSETKFDLSTFIPTFCYSMREKSHWAICSVFKVLANKPASMLEIIQGLTDGDREIFMKQICNYALPKYNPSAQPVQSLPYEFISSVFTCTSLNLLILLRPSLTETQTQTENRKQIQQLLYTHQEDIKRFLKFATDHVLSIVFNKLQNTTNPTTEDTIALDGSNYFCNLLEFLSREELCKQDFKLSAYVPFLTEFRARWIESNDKCLQASYPGENVGFHTNMFSEPLVSSPVTGYHPDGKTVVTFHSLWSVVCLSLFLSRFHRLFGNTDAALNDPFLLRIQIEQNVQQSKLSLYAVQDNYGRFQASTEAALLLIEELMHTTVDVEALYNAMGKTLYYRAKGLSLMNIDEQLSASARKELLPKNIQLALDIPGLCEDVRAKVVKLSLSFTDNKICHFCMTHGTSLLRCSRCKAVYYCNKNCQKQDWTCHKPSCKK